LKAFDNFNLDIAKLYCEQEEAAGRYPDPVYCYRLGLQVDAVFRGTKASESQPPAIILDFLYGVASYALWKSREETYAVLKKYRKDNYESIPIPLRAPLSDDDSPDGPSGRSKIIQGGVRRGHKMARAMDEMNLVMMLLCGTTPDEVARRREKQMGVEEQRAQEAGKRKVVEWLQTDSDTVA